TKLPSVSQLLASLRTPLERLSIREQLMKRSPRRSRSVIAESLNKRLNYYALAASAAGVGLLSLSQPANAEIIFTPANVTTGAPGSTYNLDLNNDGIPDFTIKGYGDGVY